MTTDVTTFACVWVDGHVHFSSEYVVRLRDAVARYYPLQHRFVCLTDRPWSLPEDIKTITVRHDRSMKGWWPKVQLFNPTHGWSGRVVALDLDVLVVSNLLSIVRYPARFALVPDGAPNFKGHGKLQVVKRYNSSVMVWNGGDNSEIFTRWTPDVTKRLWGDQDWIGETCPNADCMPLEWFPRISEIKPPMIPRRAKIVLCKKPKNVQAAAQWPWFKEAWHGSARL